MKAFKLTALGSAAIVLTLSGCANLQTSTKTIVLNNGKSTSVDAKQRLVISNQKVFEYTDVTDPNNPVKKSEIRNIICAEPSPDALSILGASGALSISNPTNTSGSASGSLAESAATIGLRTQSIQLLRDFNYRICESYLNNGISEDGNLSLLRRGQSVMMGLIAIEQLTGPVVASQVALASSVASGKKQATPAEIEAAQKAKDDRQAVLLDAQKDSDKSKSVYDEAVVKRDDAINELSSLPGVAEDATDEQKSARDEKEKALKEKVSISKSDLKQAELDYKDKQNRLAAAISNYKEAVAAHNKLRDGDASSSAASTAEIAASRDASKEVSVELIKGVNQIVEKINNSFVVDTCLSIMSDYARISLPGSTFTQEDRNSYRIRVEACNDILTRMTISASSSGKASK